MYARQVNTCSDRKDVCRLGGVMLVGDGAVLAIHNIITLPSEKAAL